MMDNRNCVALVRGRNRLRGKREGWMLTEDGDTRLRSILRLEARAQGFEPDQTWLTAALGSVIRLFEAADTAYEAGKATGSPEVVGHVYEARMPSGAVVIMAEERILSLAMAHLTRPQN